jgi:acylphosphatase
LNGYAKNLWDGTVEVATEGEESAIEELHTELNKGPSRSYVESVKIERGEYKGIYSYFDVH